MSDKGNEKRSLLVNLSKKSNGYDTNSIVTSLGPNSFSLSPPLTVSSSSTSPLSPSKSIVINSTHPHPPVTLNLNNSAGYSKMQKKRSAPPRPVHQQNDDDESNFNFFSIKVIDSDGLIINSEWAIIKNS